MAVADPIEASALPRKRCSIEAWVAMDEHPTWGGIFSAIEDNGPAESGILLGSRGRSFAFGLSSKGTGDRDGRMTYLTADSAIERGRWYHVVGTYDGEHMRLYVDGELSAESAEQSGEIFYSPTHTVAAYRDRDEEYRLIGAIHEVALHDQTLREADIKRHFKKLAGRLPKPENTTFNDLPEEEGTPLHELQPRIDQAIDDGVKFLLLNQHRDGSWDHVLSSYRNGTTSLAVYTLLKCGLKPSHPAVVQGLQFLGEKDPLKTYSAGCQLMALGATRDPAHEPWARRLVERVIEWESGSEPGGWAYPGGRVDLSNTQFAALGFWGASELGIEVPVKLWRRMIEKAVEHHQPLPSKVDWPGSAKPRSGKRKIAGFTDFKDGVT